MSVVDLLGASDAPMLAQPFYADGDPGPIVSSLAHVPELLEVALPFIGAALGASAIDFRTKEIVILRTSALLRCRYCVQTHAVIAHDAELSVAQIDALCQDDADVVAAAFPDARDRTLIEWTDVVAAGKGSPPAALADAVNATFDQPDVVELTMLVGATLMLNRYASALGLPTSADSLRRIAELGILTDVDEQIGLVA